MRDIRVRNKIRDRDAGFIVGTSTLDTHRLVVGASALRSSIFRDLWIGTSLVWKGQNTRLSIDWYPVEVAWMAHPKLGLSDAVLHHLSFILFLLRQDCYQLELHENIQSVDDVKLVQWFFFRLLAAEEQAMLCRDDSTEGLKFYPNRFLIDV